MTQGPLGDDETRIIEYFMFIWTVGDGFEYTGFRLLADCRA